MNWIQKISQQSISIEMENYSKKVYAHIRSFINPMDPDSFTKEEADKYASNIISETYKNMQNIVNIVQNALSNIDWNGSSISIEDPEPSSEARISGYLVPDYSSPATDASVRVGNHDAWGGPATFTFFVMGDRIEIDDILDAGDDDFFTNSKTEQDYFNLIREIRNPGSSKTGKFLTLYTARPVKDREQYMNATELPSNLFLTSSFNRAQGIGLDLSGSEKLRDIWKVRIEEKYLTQTLDGLTKDYQITGNGSVPIKSIVLIDPGEL